MGRVHEVTSLKVIIKRQLTGWKKIFASYSLDKELISRIIKHHRTSNPVNKWAG
jgi:hypothetical protein